MDFRDFFRSISAVFCLALVAGTASAQLGFNPNIVNGVVEFEDTPVDDVSREWVTMTGEQANDALMDVSVQVGGNGIFTANPANFRIEPGQQVAVTFSFTPDEEGEFEAALRVVAGSDQGRQWIYEATLRGAGIGVPSPEIEISPGSIELRIEEEDGVDEESLTIRNSGDTELSWNIPAFNAGWLTIAPRNGRVAAGAEAAIRLTTNDLPEENGEYRVVVAIRSNDEEHPSIDVPVTLTVAIPIVETQTISLRRGWNVVSLNVSPGDEFRRDGEVVLRELIAEIEDRVVLIKDQDGNFVWPERGFWDGIRNWNPSYGYWIKTSEAFDWEVTGEPIAMDTPISLRRGWNVIAYYPRREDEPRFLFSELEEAGILGMVKGPLGQFYVPGWNFYYWVLRPNDGVLVKVTEAVEFRYPNE